MIISIINQE